MPSALDHALNSPQTAIGKGTVGEPTPPPEGKNGLCFKVALFFDGTMNNRTNTEVRIAKKDTILDNDKKDMLSSYANFYSNVAILELLNKQRVKEKQEVSVYVEGIGTVDFEVVPGAIAKDKDGKDKVDKNGQKILATDADFSNDVMGGYAFGTGETGIVDRVTKGIREAKVAIRKAYNPDRQYIEKITIDVVGFSRGAAAARHCVSRYEGFKGVWPSQLRLPELKINFVGLYETVSSYDVSENKAITVPKALIGTLFTKNVSELQLALGGVPKRVVHLTAQDEIRHNFALTTIDSSLRAGVGFQISLPGVHSDIGGGYVERDPENLTMDPDKTYPNDPDRGRPAIRPLNRERRRMFNRAEKQQLVEEGWYTDGSVGTRDQFLPVDSDDYARHRTWEDHRANVAQANGQSYQRAPYMGAEYGTRYLTNEYQYVTLYLMMQMAKNKLRPGAHTEMVFEDLGDDKFATYRVPPDLVAVRNHFEAYIQDKAADGAPHNRLDFTSEEQEKKTRNKYLHRSSVILKESTGSMKDLKTYFAYNRNTNDTRRVFSDADGVAEAPAVPVPELWNEEPQVAGVAELNQVPEATSVPAMPSVPATSAVPEAP